MSSIKIEFITLWNVACSFRYVRSETKRVWVRECETAFLVHSIRKTFFYDRIFHFEKFVRCVPKTRSGTKKYAFTFDNTQKFRDCSRKSGQSIVYSQFSLIFAQCSCVWTKFGSNFCLMCVKMSESNIVISFFSLHLISSFFGLFVLFYLISTVQKLSLAMQSFHLICAKKVRGKETKSEKKPQIMEHFKLLNANNGRRWREKSTKC